MSALLPAAHGTLVAPPPPRWSSYATSTITVAWDAMTDAVSYDLQFTDPDGVVTGPVNVLAPLVQGDIDCDGTDDGRPMDI